MWCAVANFEVWGPYFFEEDKAISVASTRYVQTLQNLLKPKLQILGKNVAVWFQQDGATGQSPIQQKVDVLRGLFQSI